jgi:hypothetical protein
MLEDELLPTTSAGVDARGRRLKIRRRRRLLLAGFERDGCGAGRRRRTGRGTNGGDVGTRRRRLEARSAAEAANEPLGDAREWIGSRARAVPSEANIRGF